MTCRSVRKRQESQRISAASSPLAVGTMDLQQQVATVHTASHSQASKDLTTEGASISD